MTFRAVIFIILSLCLAISLIPVIKYPIAVLFIVLSIIVLYTVYEPKIRGLFPSYLLNMPQKYFIIFIIFISLIPRLTWVLSIPNHQVSDFAIYHELSKALVEGKGYTLTGPVGQEDIDLYLGKSIKLPYTTAHRSPGTAFWGAAIYKLFGENQFYFKISNVILGTGISLLIFFILSSSGLMIAARIASTFWAIYPSGIFATNLFCSEILFTFFLLLTALLLSSKTYIKTSISGVTAACSALIRSLWLPITASVVP